MCHRDWDPIKVSILFNTAALSKSLSCFLFLQLDMVAHNCSLSTGNAEGMSSRPAWYMWSVLLLGMWTDICSGPSELCARLSAAPGFIANIP